MSYMNEAYEHTADESHTHAYLNKIVLRHLPAQKLNIREVGCSNGLFSEKLSHLGHRVTGVDASQEGIAIAQSRSSAASFIRYSAYDDFSGLGSGPYDLILAMEVIEHLFDPFAFFQNAQSNLAVGGRLIITTPYHGFLKNLALS